MLRRQQLHLQFQQQLASATLSLGQLQRYHVRARHEQYLILFLWAKTDKYEDLLLGDYSTVLLTELCDAQPVELCCACLQPSEKLLLTGHLLERDGLHQ